MTATGAPPGLSDQQLAELVRFVAHICLEVERDLRPPDHLLRLFDVATANRWRRQGSTTRLVLGRFAGGPVLPADIRVGALSRLGHDHVLATVVTPTSPGRFGAVTVGLRSRCGRWHLADLQRLLSAGDYRRAGVQTATDQPSPPDQRPAVRVDQRRLAAAALSVTMAQLSEVRPDEPDYRQLCELADRWRRTLAEFDKEAAELHAARRLQDQPGRVARP